MGFDYKKYIAGLKKKVEGEVPLTQLFSEAFMAEHTMFESLEAMVAASPLAKTPAEDLPEALGSPAWDAFVAERTRFPTWKKMLRTAERTELHRRLDADEGGARKP